MTTCFFVSDLHGIEGRYLALFDAVAQDRPSALFIGGDLLPNCLTWRGRSRGADAGAAADFAPADSDFAAADSDFAGAGHDLAIPLDDYTALDDDFISDFLFPGFASLRRSLGPDYPSIFLIMGNDDERCLEEDFLEGEAAGLWHYMHGRKRLFQTWGVYGYAFTPPSPFGLKDWERYDVSRYVDPGCVSPEEGFYTIEISEREKRLATIDADLRALCGDDDLANAILLFHAPPYATCLDRAGLDGRSVEHAPMDVHVGSIAMRRLIESRRPLLTLHGHIHESARLTGTWRDRLGSTWMFSAAHDGPELALIRFDPADPERADRRLIPAVSR